MNNPIQKNIYFKNDLDIPIMLDSWRDGSNKLHMIRVGSKETVIATSGMGYWYLNSMLKDPIDRQQWVDAGYKDYVSLGNFSSMPCAQGNYSWLEHPNIFKCEYTPTSKDDFVPGLITFGLNNDYLSSNTTN